MATDDKISIRNKHGKPVKLFFPNGTFDLLGRNVPNVPELIQTEFSKEEEQLPLLGERALKKVVRSIVFKKATENLTREELI